jgi:hypothetical protein
MSDTNTGSSKKVVVAMIVVLLAGFAFWHVATRRQLPAPSSSAAVALAKFSPSEEQLFEEYKKNMGIALNSSVKTGAKKEEGGADVASINVVKSVASKYFSEGVSASPYRNSIRKKMFDDFLNNHNGKQQAEEVLMNVDRLKISYPQNQDKMRLFALKLLQYTYKQGIVSREESSEFLKNIAERIAADESKTKAWDVDYGFILSLHLELVGWSEIKKDPVRFRYEIGYNDVLEPIIRKNLLSRAEADGSPENPSTVINAIRDGV